ncbi:NAD-dependent succinate-semialdehyde dehydrogenase [Paraburkholderia sp. RL17-337-BIB-A]|uniref:NAD-dependent succinate-semialdehyde dehydrogenase n=1 Tax=Paraburkholderia sp. RL17-337-BIB-A TaxID=3031636 RepID=UPI0038BA8175
MNTFKLNDIKVAGWLKEANYVAGNWVGADDGSTYDVEDPATGTRVGTIPWVSGAETGRAIDAAQEAFLTWSMTTAAERAEKLQRMAQLVRDNLDILATMLTLEQGKPLAEARGEMKLGADYIQWFAEEARRINGEIIPSPWKDRQILVTREPVGVVGAFSPWNFPFSMLSRKVAPALAAGCTIVIKPSEFTPYSGLLYAVLAERAGIPAGVVNVVTGDGAAVGGELARNPLVRKITFTGSTRVGKLLYKQSADSMKKLSMELGGNAPTIVFDDADLDLAVETAVAGKFRNSGQTCVCTNRFYVQESIYEEFARRLTDRVKKLKVDNGLKEGAEQGPLINLAAVEKVESQVEDAKAKGGRVLLGGKRHELGATFFEPTVIADATPDMLIAREETFGPVAALFRFKEEHEAVEAANSTEFGLAAYFYTRDLARTFRVSRAIQSGMIGINAGVITTAEAPFGGVKDSGLGREGSAHGIEEYLNLKYLSLAGL